MMVSLFFCKKYYAFWRLTTVKKVNFCLQYSKKNVKS